MATDIAGYRSEEASDHSTAWCQLWPRGAEGTGTAPLATGRTPRIKGGLVFSWVSFRDVAEICAVALRHPAAERRTIEFGGPEALSPLEVVARFERIGGRPFRLEHVPEAALLSQFEGATDSMQKSFAALMLGYLHGDAINMTSVMDTFGIKLTNVNEYARSVLEKPETP